MEQRDATGSFQRCCRYSPEEKFAAAETAAAAESWWRPSPERMEGGVGGVGSPAQAGGRLKWELKLEVEISPCEAARCWRSEGDRA